MLDLKTEYHMFLFDNLYNKLLDTNKLNYLNDGFIDNVHFSVWQYKDEPLKHLLHIDNIKKPLDITIMCKWGKGKYIVFDKRDFSMPVPDVYMKKLYKQGLYMASTNYDSALMAIHRLVACLSYNLNGMEVHHINKNKSNNCLENIVPTPKEVNRTIEICFKDMDDLLEIGRRLKKFQKPQKFDRLQQKQKITVGRNERLHLRIIEYGIEHTITATIIKKFKKLIKTPQTIRDILNYFFYRKEFIQWMKNENVYYRFT